MAFRIGFTKYKLIFFRINETLFNIDIHHRHYVLYKMHRVYYLHGLGRNIIKM